MSWTDDRVDVLKKLWLEGRTASQIASELGGVTRNAVIGKVHRLGLSGRPSPIKRKTRKSEARKTKTTRRAKKTATTKTTAVAKKAATTMRTNVVDMLNREDTFKPANGGKTMMELRDSMCKWPIGDPKSDEFRFCGCKATEGLPYCEHHAAIAYQNVKRRRKVNEDELAKL
tara:strand:- start:194 stop:709 length:516 start_codon:yes stop_codon:yes gene_type:complete